MPRVRNRSAAAAGPSGAAEPEATLESAARALLASEERYRELFESSGDLVQSVGPDGHFEYVNPNWLATLGYSPEEVPGLRFQDLVAPEELDHCLGIFGLLTSKRQEHLRIETIFLTKGGRPVYLEGSVSSTFEGDRFVATRGFFRDVTERKRLEAERQTYLERIERQKVDLEIRNREVERTTRHKSEFLATMSHELRTPLTAIIGFSDLLADGFAGTLTETQANYLGFVRKGARHLLQLINDVLDMSKIEAGRLELDREDLPVAEVVAEVRSTVEPLAAAKELEITCDVAPDLLVFADRVRLKQIFYNLVSNAVKFSPDGGSIRIEGARIGRFACLSVRDNGPGIGGEHQRSIFLPFSQLPGSRREGTGLGLAIVRRLVEQHGGRIWVESAPGRGSVFAFLLPIGRPAELRAAAGPALQAEERERPLIAVVEDDPAWRELLASHLEAGGYEVTVLPWESNAAVRLRALGPDLVLLEPLAGQSGGWRLLEQLGAAGGELAAVVVSDLDERRRGFALGAVDYLVKPVSRELLLEAVARHVPSWTAAKPAPVLLLDHRLDRQRAIADAIREAGFRPLAARDGKEALEILAWVHPFALVVCLDLPEMDGFQTILRLRSDPTLAALPILALTTETHAEDGGDLMSGNTRLLEIGVAYDPGVVARELRQMLGTTSAAAPRASERAGV